MSPLPSKTGARTLLAVTVALGAWGVALAQGRGHAAETRGQSLPGAQPTRPAGQDRPDEDALFGGEEAPARQGSAPAPADRPSEDALFGGDERPTAPAEPSAPPGAEDARPGDPGAGEDDRDAKALSGPATQSLFDREGGEVDDPLRIGGQFYFRAQTSTSQGTARPSDALFTAPTLVDVYLDARPTERVRGFVSGRLVYDASLPLGSGSASGSPTGGTGNTPASDPAQGSGSATAGAGLFGSRPNPSTLLDQAWLRFDIERAVFLTIGKQHVRWGVSRFFNPTDFLSPQRRDPLAVFDARVGASMVKVHVPVESLGWNFYAIGLLDNAGPASVLGQLGGALRAELLLGPAEVAVGAVVQRGVEPRYAFNVSSPLGPLDVYGELALRRGADRPQLRAREGTDPISELRVDRGVYSLPSAEDLLRVSGQLEQVEVTDWNAQASGGLTYSLAYSENDSVMLGVEYGYNSLGTDDPRLYPAQLLLGTFQNFYAARHYGALYAVFLDPGPLERTQLIVSSIANLSDRSAVARLDVIYRALQYLQVEAFGSVNYGRPGGEFRLGMDFQLPERGADGLPILENGRLKAQRLSAPIPVASFGLGLRINI